MPAEQPCCAPGWAEASRGVRVRHVLNWVNLSTPLGLLVARAGGARVRRGPQLLRLAEHYRWPFPTGSAFTVGDVVISRYDLERLGARIPGLLAHEEAHSRQWAACLGLPFLPLYLASMGWSWVRTGDRAARSVFERHAGLALGGYRDVPVRPIAAAFLSFCRVSYRSRWVRTASMWSWAQTRNCRVVA